jgi:hypothetical protein
MENDFDGDDQGGRYTDHCEICPGKPALIREGRLLLCPKCRGSYGEEWLLKRKEP